MFLVFSLHRMDVFTVGDLGVQRGFEAYLAQRPWLKEELRRVDWSVPLEGTHSPGKSAKSRNRKSSAPKNHKGVSSAPINKQMEYVANKFRPHRTAFQMVLWKLAGTDVEIVEAKRKAKEEAKAEAKKVKEEAPRSKSQSPE
jgi:DNA-3-methyladenine glycosylase II